MATATRTIRAPRGTSLTCKGWPQEAALRMLHKNLDADVAERPDDLVVYGGSGKAARNWPAFHAIARTLRDLEGDETLLVQSGKPVGVFRTHPFAPRVLIANSLLVPDWATWDEFWRLEAMGLTAYGQMTAGSWIYIGTQGILQGTFQTFAAVTDRPPAHDPLFGYIPVGLSLDEAEALRASDPDEYVRRARASMARHCAAMVGFRAAGAEVFDYGNNLRGEAREGGFADAFAYPGFVPAYLRPLFAEGKGPFRWVALSGDPADIAA